MHWLLGVVLWYVTCVACRAFCFFSDCYGAHRDLHSFPTRRSSDPDDARRLRVLLTPRGQSVLARIEAAVIEERARDRKSTRLNSSHRCISYAVFCLKKKKIHNLFRLNFTPTREPDTPQTTDPAPAL